LKIVFPKKLGHKKIYMNRIRVFISSVQTEFAAERQMVFDYLQSDPLLGRFFEPFFLSECRLLASRRRSSTSIIFVKDGVTLNPR